MVVEEQVVRRIRDCATANPGLTFILNGREMGGVFNWASLSARNWSELLAEQPQFAGNDELTFDSKPHRLNAKTKDSRTSMESPAESAEDAKR